MYVVVATTAYPHEVFLNVAPALGAEGAVMDLGPDLALAQLARLPDVLKMKLLQEQGIADAGGRLGVRGHAAAR